MSVDKLVDSSQLDTDLTSVANAIRTKGGTSAQLAFPAGFVSAIQAIPTGGGGDDLADVPWVRNKQTITIGANTVANGAQVKTYFSSYANYLLIALNTAPSVNNQVVAAVLNLNGTTSTILRYRSGSLGLAGAVSNYDCVLVEGTQYIVYKY